MATMFPSWAASSAWKAWCFWSCLTFSSRELGSSACSEASWASSCLRREPTQASASAASRRNWASSRPSASLPRLAALKAFTWARLAATSSILLRMVGLSKWFC
uniref:Putative secreted protein n=1 Tax=Ixodes ricinus TaxID=34613 RepID=A0A6B0UFS1_IXORI